MNDHRADDQFCDQLCREYEADPDRGQFVTLEAAALACVVALGAIERGKAAEKYHHCGNDERVSDLHRRPPCFLASERMFDRCECSFTPVAERRLQGKF